MLGLKSWIIGKLRRVMLEGFETRLMARMDEFSERIMASVASCKIVEDRIPKWVAEALQIEASGLFDATAYVRANGARMGGLSPIAHYVLKGWHEGCEPGPSFDGKRYAQFYRLSSYGFNGPPLCHYLRVGIPCGLHAFPPGETRREYFPESMDMAAYGARRDKVLVAVHELSITGVPKLSLSIIRMMNRDDVRAALIAPADGPLRQLCAQEGVPLIVDPDFFFEKPACCAYRDTGYCFVLFNTACIVGSFLMADEILPSMLWVHENVDRFWFSERERELLKEKPNVFATSFITQALVREYAPKVRSLPYPVEDVCERPHKAPGRRLRFGIFGYVAYDKGQDLALAALSHLPEGVRDECELLIVGDARNSDFERRLKAEAKGLPVSFRPTVRDVRKYHALYDEIDVLLSSSRTDPMPLTVIDAMMHGCPVILSDKVGQSIYVRDGENGFVFESGSGPSLMQALVRMICAKGDYGRMSALSRRTFDDNFAAEKSMSEILAAFDEQMNRREGILTKGTASVMGIAGRGAEEGALAN